MIKIQRLASISCQTDQNNSKLQKRSNYNVLHRFDVKTIKNVAFRRKTFERKQNYKSNQITTICIDLTSKRSKMLSYVAKHSKQHKTTKVIKLRQFASIWRQNDQKSWVTSQNIPNNAKLRKWSKYNYLHRLDVEKIKNVALSRQTFKTTQNYKSDHITMNFHRFDVKTIKMLSYVAKHSKQHKTTKVIKLQWLASIWCQKHQNNSKLQNDQITMNCIDLTS